ncbi:hypothetical protein [Salmonella enterica]|nr:hypothetical protein [Salmonella enterica]
MNTSNRFKASLAAAAMLALPVITNGCSSVSDAQSYRAVTIIKKVL